MEDPQGINGKSVSKQCVSPKKKVIAFKVVIIFVATKSLEGFRKLHALLMIGSSGLWNYFSGGGLCESYIA